MELLTLISVFAFFKKCAKQAASLLRNSFQNENCWKNRNMPSTDSSNVFISQKTKILFVVNCFGKSFSKTVNCREFGLFRTWNTRTKVQEAGERCEKFGKILRNMTMPEGWSYSLKSYHEPSFRIAVLHKRRFSQFARYDHQILREGWSYSLKSYHEPSSELRCYRSADSRSLREINILDLSETSVNE